MAWNAFHRSIDVLLSVLERLTRSEAICLLCSTKRMYQLMQTHERVNRFLCLQWFGSAYPTLDEDYRFKPETTFACRFKTMMRCVQNVLENRHTVRRPPVSGIAILLGDSYVTATHNQTVLVGSMDGTLPPKTIVVSDKPVDYLYLHRCYRSQTVVLTQCDMYRTSEHRAVCVSTGQAGSALGSRRAQDTKYRFQDIASPNLAIGTEQSKHNSSVQFADCIKGQVGCELKLIENRPWSSDIATAKVSHGWLFRLVPSQERTPDKTAFIVQLEATDMNRHTTLCQQMETKKEMWYKPDIGVGSFPYNLTACLFTCTRTHVVVVDEYAFQIWLYARPSMTLLATEDIKEDQDCCVLRVVCGCVVISFTDKLKQQRHWIVAPHHTKLHPLASFSSIERHGDCWAYTAAEWGSEHHTCYIETRDGRPCIVDYRLPVQDAPSDVSQPVAKRRKQFH